MTGWCLHGRHARCSHNPGGACFGGVVLTNGQIFACRCGCHRVGGVQLDLFGNTLVNTGFEVQK